MTLSRRTRREWRIFLWVSVAAAAVSAWFGYRVAPVEQPALLSMLQGALTSMLIATPVVWMQLKGGKVARWTRGLPFGAYVAIKSVFYFVVIIGGLVLARVLFTSGGFQLDDRFRQSIVFAVGMSIFGNLLFDLGGLLGFGTLRNLFMGRYARPRSEQRAFLLIDMKDSTGLAERLGPIQFHELLNDFFRDVADAALECQAEIHKYVGDEAILTWPDDNATADNDCLACPFIARDIIAANAETYRKRFGGVPTFRAALHRGEIVAGEIGDVRREIAYVGDTLNVAARLLDAAKSSGYEVLVSADLLARTTLPGDLRQVPLPTLSVRGRAAPLEIAALERRAAS